MNENGHYPRLLYLADVPVEASYHGSALVHRLLEDYPKDRLLIVEAGLDRSQPERRIPDVRYRQELLPFRRLHYTRFNPWITAATLRSAALRSSRFAGIAKPFSPDAILTVTHGFSWITAATLARRLGVPLHLICHDEWARAGSMQDWKDKVFGEHYRQAASRLCVSPYMAAEYEQRYGVPGDVLYPSRAKDAVRYPEPPSRLAEPSRRFTCVFAGTINSGGAVQALRHIARALSAIGGRLLIFGPLSADLASQNGLSGPAIELGGLLSPSDLMARMRDEADVLLVPMSFEESDRNNMQISFPSKLTDYTAVGVPLLIYGPDYCSAVRWANDHKGAAATVAGEGEAGLLAALERMRSDAAYRLELARTAIAVGETYFSHRAAGSGLREALGRTTRARGTAW